MISEQAPSSLLARAEQAAGTLQWGEAADLLADAGDSSEVLSSRAFFLSRAKRYDEALCVLAVLRQREPTRARWFYMTAYQYYEQQRYPDALPWFEQARALDPDHVPNLYRLAQTYRRLGRVEHAKQPAGRVLRLWHGMADDDKKRHVSTLARASYLLGKLQADRDPAGAAELFEQAVTHEPEDGDKHYQLGKTYRRLGRHAEATAALDRAHRLKPQADYIAIELAQSLAADGAADRAADVLRRWVGRARGWTAFKAARVALEIGVGDAAARLLNDASRHRDVRQSVEFTGLRRQVEQLVPQCDSRNSADATGPHRPDNGQAHTGRVDVAKPERGFGFLIDDSDGSRRYFKMSRQLRLRRGDRVSFVPRDAEKGPAAGGVTAIR